MFLYQIYNGSLTTWSAVSSILDILGIGTASFDIVRNFVNNLVAVFAYGGNIWDVVKIIPDFARTILGMLPATKVLIVITRAYDIASLA
ncbi:hypothetical protein H7E67_09655 [Clostridium gasigenes]|uniref:hypothetical protein n=1 Tax=Clostridium gasigenes TaxID=94869 RepID=UPI0016239CDE|nr:hypothetical protein [Clostridium gasigenes]MBB6623695.1 hypothetical protein [Clostridium gasigenes]MBU3088827.1 hypothetical protein [Clostridium gasigenes]